MSLLVSYSKRFSSGSLHGLSVRCYVALATPEVPACYQPGFKGRDFATGDRYSVESCEVRGSWGREGLCEPGWDDRSSAEVES